MIKFAWQKFISYIKRAVALKRRRQIFNSNTDLKNLYSIFQNSPEGGWIIGKNDAVELYELIKKYDPQNILELGSGIGAATAVMALASSGQTKITALEQFEKCVQLAKKLIPENLRTKINFVYSPAMSWEDARISKYLNFSTYQGLPTHLGPFDFVLVDGPDYWLENQELVTLPNGDLVKLIPHLSPGCKIYVDGRKNAVLLYKRFLGPYLNLIHENFEYALFERNDKKLDDFKNLEIQDATLEWLKGTSYFN